LQVELEECEQNSVELRSLKIVSKQLASNELLRHKDNGVLAVTACCLADILKLYAVDVPPYSDSELKVSKNVILVQLQAVFNIYIKAIFGLFISQLKELTNSTNVYYRDRFYLLESLSMVQSILIIKQLSNSASIMTELFKTIFSLAK